MTHTSAAFFIGKTHRVCEDYALAPNLAGALSAAWLCDGCSSSPNTDMGARLLSHAIQKNRNGFAAVAGAGAGDGAQTAALQSWIQAGMARAARCAQAMGLPPKCLDVTLLGVVAPGSSPAQEQAYAVVCGDGAAVFGLSDGGRIVYRVQYGAGYPFYPAYWQDKERLALWQAVENNAQTITRTTLRPDGSVQSAETWTPQTPCYLLRYPAESLRFAAVFSDGLESFHEADGSAVPCLDVVLGLTAFKSFKGDFALRRMQAFKKECEKRGRYHNDDLSVAALAWQEGE